MVRRHTVRQIGHQYLFVGTRGAALLGDASGPCREKLPSLPTTSGVLEIESIERERVGGAGWDRD